MEGVSGSSVGETDLAAVLRLCHRLCVARAAVNVTTGAGSVSDSGLAQLQWEPLPHYVSVDQYT